MPQGSCGADTPVPLPLTLIQFFWPGRKSLASLRIRVRVQGSFTRAKGALIQDDKVTGRFVPNEKEPRLSPWPF
jgi:hypothetical protein